MPYRGIQSLGAGTSAADSPPLHTWILVATPRSALCGRRPANLPRDAPASAASPPKSACPIARRTSLAIGRGLAKRHFADARICAHLQPAITRGRHLGRALCWRWELRPVYRQRCKLTAARSCRLRLKSYREGRSIIYAQSVPQGHLCVCASATSVFEYLGYLRI